MSDRLSDLSIVHSVHTGPGEHPASCLTDIAVFVLGIKRPGRDAEHIRPIWLMYTGMIIHLLYVFLISCHLLLDHRVNSCTRWPTQVNTNEQSYCMKSGWPDADCCQVQRLRISGSVYLSVLYAFCCYGLSYCGVSSLDYNAWDDMMIGNNELEFRSNWLKPNSNYPSICQVGLRKITNSLRNFCRL